MDVNIFLAFYGLLVLLVVWVVGVIHRLGLYYCKSLIINRSGNTTIEIDCPGWYKSHEEFQLLFGWLSGAFDTNPSQIKVGLENLATVLNLVPELPGRKCAIVLAGGDGLRYLVRKKSELSYHRELIPQTPLSLRELLRLPEVLLPKVSGVWVWLVVAAAAVSYAQAIFADPGYLQGVVGGCLMVCMYLLSTVFVPAYKQDPIIYWDGVGVGHRELGVLYESGAVCLHQLLQSIWFHRSLTMLTILGIATCILSTDGGVAVGVTIATCVTTLLVLYGLYDQNFFKCAATTFVESTRKPPVTEVDKHALVAHAPVVKTRNWMMGK